jgi:hypothetical protein
VSDIRYRIEQLLSDTSAFTAGQTEERQRIRQLIDIRIDQLRTVPRTELLCAELLHVRHLLDT